MGLLTVGTVYALWRSSVIPRPIGNPIARKSRTNASWIHVVTGAGGLAMALYAVGLERIYRESPGWTWMWVSSAMFMANALSYGPLMNIFKASKEGKYAMQLGYSFVASFQGVVWIAWSAQPDAPEWMFWAVMPYWYFSLAKLWESTEFVLALTPKPADADGLWAKVTSGSRKRLGRMSPDAATLTYVGLNAAAAVFDNCYMALYTLLGPEQFWHTSQAFNDSDFHLRLVKGYDGIAHRGFAHFHLHPRMEEADADEVRDLAQRRSRLGRTLDCALLAQTTRSVGDVVSTIRLRPRFRLPRIFESVDVVIRSLDGFYYEL